MANIPDPLSRRYINSAGSFRYSTGPLSDEVFNPEAPWFRDVMTSINSEAAIKLREKFAQHNDALKKRMGEAGKNVPIVLIPKHDLKIYRHIKNYNRDTGYLDHGKEFELGSQAQALRNAAAAADDTINALLQGLGVPTTVSSSAAQERENAIGYFEIHPKDGMNDFLGIKFEYTYDKEITTFTLSFNNERGKNRNRFMSGDVVEFYFDLVSEDVIVKLEQDNFVVKKEDIITPLPLVFTGVLEEFSCNESNDGLTIDWSGRNGAYILAETSINFDYPTATETLCTSHNTMSYEEILWNMIVFNTGMVVGEIDLGNKRQFYYLGSAGDDVNQENQDQDNMAQEANEDNASTMDLMDVNGINQPNVQAGRDGQRISNFAEFKKGLEAVMARHEYCTLNANKPDGSPQVRWSSLLDFDLLKPKIFSMAEVEGKAFDPFGGGVSTSGGSAGEGSDFAPGLLGSYIYGSEAGGDAATLPPSIRFKTKFARDIFVYQYNIMQRNYENILLAAPIKTQVLFSEGERVKSILITRQMCFNSLDSRNNPVTIETSNRDPKNKSGLPLLRAIYNEIIVDLQRSGRGLNIDSNFDAWLDRVRELYKQSAATDQSSRFTVTQENFTNTEGQLNPSITLYGGLNQNRDASPMPLVIQDPDKPPTIGAVLKVPYPVLKEYSILHAFFYPRILAQDSTLLGSTEEQPTLDAILKVRSMFPMNVGVGEKITIQITEAAQQANQPSSGATSAAQRLNKYVDIRVTVEKVTGFGSGNQASLLVPVNQTNVPNNLSIIASILDNSGYLTATMTSLGLNAPSQPIGIPGDLNYGVVGERLGGGAVQMVQPTADNLVKVGDCANRVTFKAKGKVLECAKKAIDKFFGCVLYVDEFNIAHIRPRYKMLQFEHDPETPPVWGLYGGQPVYPRLFSATWKDKLQITPNAVVVIGESSQAVDPYIIAKAGHGLLQGRFGERQVLEDGANESFNNKFEAYNCAKNKLLSYIRNGYQASVECDIIPSLRPGHRIDIADFVTGMIGGFLIENIQWHYAKHEGMKMVLNLSSQMLTTEDAFTTTAIASETGFNEGFLARNYASGEKQTGFFETLFRTSNIEALKAASDEQLKIEDEELERQRELYKNRDPLVFNLEEPGRITFDRRKGFEASPPSPENIPTPSEDTPGGESDGGGGGVSW